MDELRPNPRRTLVPLSQATLSELPEDIERPRYDRATLTPGIVHIGLGNFHRAHQAWYLHRLMQMGQAQDWAILGAGVRPYDTQMREKLLAQDCLTTLIELAPEHRAAEVIGPMIDYLPIEPDNAALIAAMSDPAIRIVALTVTEGGYFVDPNTEKLDLNHPEILHDIAHPQTPHTAFGAMVAALRNRKQTGDGPFTCMSCDNLSGNGSILRQTVIGLARQSDPDLADWIEHNAAFPNSMVDCIVPATGPEELALVKELGIQDAAPVSHENFRQWVLEDKFCNGRPEWGRVGVTLADNVHDYELMKIRVLNAGHQVLANIGELLSLETISDCMANEYVSAFFKKVQTEEILPYVPAVPGMSSADYLTQISHRFANPAIRDTTRRVAFDGNSRHMGFILPILRDALRAGGSVQGLALVEALWARMCLGRREDGSEIVANDPNWNALNAAAKRAERNPQAWLAQQDIYGGLAQCAPFAQAFQGWHNMLCDDGSIAAVTKYLSGQLKNTGIG